MSEVEPAHQRPVDSLVIKVCALGVDRSTGYQPAVQ